MKCLAHTEAVIDFGDDDREGDINDSAMNPLVPIISRLRNELEYHLRDGRKGEIIREGIQIVLVGQPNAGKLQYACIFTLHLFNLVVLSYRKIFFDECTSKKTSCDCFSHRRHHQVRSTFIVGN